MYRKPLQTNPVILSFSFVIAITLMLLTFGSAQAQQPGSTVNNRLCDTQDELSKVDLLIMVDESRSMTPSRRQAVREALIAIGDELARAVEVEGDELEGGTGRVSIRVALSSFRKEALPNTREKFSEVPLGWEEILAVTDGVNEPSTNGTNYLAAFNRAIEIFEDEDSNGACRVLLFFTDGVAAKTKPDDNNKAWAENLSNFASDQRNAACQSNGIAQNLADAQIKTVAVMLSPTNKRNIALKYSLEMLLAITSESESASAVVDLSSELEGDKRPDLQNCGAYNEGENGGRIISAANAPDVLNALLIPVYELTQFRWDDCAEITGNQAETQLLPAGKYLNKLSIFVQGGEISSANASGNQVDVNPRNLILNSQDLESFPSGWWITLNVRSIESSDVTLQCFASPKVQEDITGLLQSNDADIFAIGKTKSGEFDPEIIDLVIPYSCDELETLSIKTAGLSDGPSLCSNDQFEFSEIRLDSNKIAIIKDQEGVQLCLEPIYGDNVFPGDCVEDSSKWPSATATFGASIFEEGEVGIDCKALKPELVVNAGAKVYVSCNFQQSDEADSTRFEISWDSNGENPWTFIKNGNTSLEIEKDEDAQNPYTIVAGYDQGLEGKVCVEPYEIRKPLPDNRLDLPGSTNCVDIDFNQIAVQKLESLINCSNNNVSFGNGKEVPESPVYAKTSCTVIDDPNIEVQLTLSPSNQTVANQQVEFWVSDGKDGCNVTDEVFRGVIYLCSLTQLPNEKIEELISFNLNATLLVDEVSLATENEIETIEAQLSYQARSCVWCAIALSVPLAFIMLVIAYSIWVYAMKKSAQFMNVSDLVFITKRIDITADDDQGHWNFNTKDLDNWNPKGADFANPIISNNGQKMMLGQDVFEARTASWWQMNRLGRGGWMHHQTPNWIFKAEPGPPGSEGIGPLTFSSLVVVGIMISEPETKGVVHIVTPVDEDLQNATSEKVDQARVLFENLSEPFEKELATQKSQEISGSSDGSAENGPPDGGPDASGSSSQAPPDGGPDASGSSSQAPPDGGPDASGSSSQAPPDGGPS